MRQMLDWAVHALFSIVANWQASGKREALFATYLKICQNFLLHGRLAWGQDVIRRALKGKISALGKEIKKPNSR